MKTILNYIYESKELPSMSSLEFDYNVEELLGEIEEYFAATDDLDEGIDGNIKKFLSKIPKDTVFTIIDEYDNNSELIDDINDVLHFNKNVKQLGRTSSGDTNVTLYALDSKYIVQLNSDQDIQYFVSK